MKEKSSTPTKHNGLRLVGITVLCALLGAGAGILSVMLQDSAQNLLGSLKALLAAHLPLLALVWSLCTAVPALALHLMASRQNRIGAMEEDDAQSRFQRTLSLSQLCNTLGQVGTFLLLGSAILLHGQSAAVGTGDLLAVSGVLVLFLILSLALEVRSTRMAQRLSPRQHTDALDPHFEHRWLEGLDEAEQLEIYHAAFRSWVVMKYLFTGVWAVLVIFGDLLGIGLLPVVLVSLLWGAHSISYLLFSLKGR